MALRSDMPSPLQFQRGDIIAQRFEVVKQSDATAPWIGYTVLDRQVASDPQSPTEIHIKLLRPELCADHTTRQLLVRTLRQVRELAHHDLPRFSEVVALDEIGTIAILEPLQRSDEDRSLTPKWSADQYAALSGAIDRVMSANPRADHASIADFRSALQAAQPAPELSASSSGAHLPSPVAYGTPAGGVNMLNPALLKAPPGPPAPELLMDEWVAPGTRVVGGILFMVLVLIGVLLVVQGRTSSTIAPTIAPTVEGKNVAVLFTTTRYDDVRWPALKTTPRDAQEVAADLRDLYGFAVEKIEDPSLDDMRKKIRALTEQSYDASDQLLLMFLGHGDKDEILKKGWIIARDSKSDDRKSAYSEAELREDIDNIPCPHILLILDIGVGGSFDPGISESRGASKEASAEELVKRKRRHRSRLYLSSVDQKAEAPEGREHSPFIWKLLEALRSSGGTDGVLTWNELLAPFEKLDPKPRGGTFSKSLGSDPGGDFLFVRKPPR